MAGKSMKQREKDEMRGLMGKDEDIASFQKRTVVFLRCLAVLTFAFRRINTSCFWPENVLSLQCGSAGTALNRPFFVSVSPLQDETGPMKGFSTWHVGEITWLVGFSVPACRRNYKPCTRRQKCMKVKNVKVGWRRTGIMRAGCAGRGLRDAGTRGGRRRGAWR